MRLLGLDYGDVRTGVAISDSLGIIARALDIVPTDNALYEKIQSFIVQYGIEAVILGKPLSVKHSEETAQTKKVIAFAEELQKHIDVDIHFIDERFTSKIIEQQYRGVKEKPKHIDDLSACLILQTYLDKK